MVNKVLNYINTVYIEMRKVSWPTRNEITSSTIVVIVISMIVAAIVFILDLIFTNILSLIIK